MALRLLPEAEREIDEAFAHYQSHGLHLGPAFIASIERSYDQIEAFPKAWPTIEDDVRWCLTRRFPYAIVYVERETDIVVVAVAHLSRQRRYWLSRLAQLEGDPHSGS